MIFFNRLEFLIFTFFVGVGINSSCSAVDEIHLTIPEERVMIFRELYLSNFDIILPSCHEKLALINAGIAATGFDENVHILDNFVNANIDNLLNIADSLNLGESLSLEKSLEIAHRIYSVQYITPEYLSSICGDFNENDIKLFSKVITLANELNCTWDIDDGIAQFATIEDNQTTGGGCLPGRRNRLFIALATTMRNIGI